MKQSTKILVGLAVLATLAIGWLFTPLLGFVFVVLVVGACALYWHAGPDPERGDTPVATIIDPMTGVPDFEGYRPMESELPQTQPSAEVFEQTTTAATDDATFLHNLVASAEHNTSDTKEEG
ncbi:MAG: hypothetical protein Q4C56_00555 [Peptococcaceae bacterium]|nr:hypothetical protein [Peptococcaceae bacterium]